MGEQEIRRPEDLQFERAVPIEAPGCAACKRPLGDWYFQMQGQVICADCAARIEESQRARGLAAGGLPVRAALFGAGAAFAGFLIYALVSVVLRVQIGIVSILVGVMVGKAVRKGSNGLGGKPQQILAVALTYFAICMSYVPVAMYRVSQRRNPAVTTWRTAHLAGIVKLMGISLVAPLHAMGSGVSGLLTFAIICFGLVQASKLTGRTEVRITGPFGARAEQ